MNNPIINDPITMVAEAFAQELAHVALGRESEEVEKKNEQKE